MTILNTQSVKIPKQDGKLTVIQNFVGGNYAENLYYSYDENGNWFLLGKYDVLTSLDDVWLKYEGNRTAVEIPIAYVTPPFNTPSSQGGGNNNQGDDMIKGYGIPKKDIQANVGDIYLDKNTGDRWICYYSRSNETAWFLSNGAKESNFNVDSLDSDSPVYSSAKYDYIFPFVNGYYDEDGEYEFRQSNPNGSQIKFSRYLIGRFDKAIDNNWAYIEGSSEEVLPVCKFANDVYSDNAVGFNTNMIITTPKAYYSTSLFSIKTDYSYTDDNRKELDVIINSSNHLVFRLYGKDGLITSYEHPDAVEYGKWFNIGAIIQGGELRIFVGGDKVYTYTCGSFDNSKEPYITFDASRISLQYLRCLFSNTSDSEFNTMYTEDFTKGGINE